MREHQRQRSRLDFLRGACIRVDRLEASGFHRTDRRLAVISEQHEDANTLTAPGTMLNAAVCVTLSPSAVTSIVLRVLV
jgi:hypothetical protein